MIPSYYFIINPASLKADKKTAAHISAFFENREEKIEIVYWTKEQTVSSLVEKAHAAGFTTIVACGGDGTIREVGKALMGTSLELGILPLGSGNGIARHYNIPKKLLAALKILVQHKRQAMDVGKANEDYFFGNIGFGLEVDFIKAYQDKRRHGFGAYVVALINALVSFRYKSFQLVVADKKRTLRPFIFLLSNTKDQGYGMRLTPEASSIDGQLQLAVVHKQAAISLGFLMLEVGLFKRPLRQNNVELQSIKNLTVVANEKNIAYQLDGEYLQGQSTKVEITLLPKALQLIIP